MASALEPLEPLGLTARPSIIFNNLKPSHLYLIYTSSIPTVSRILFDWLFSFTF